MPLSTGSAGSPIPRFCRRVILAAAAAFFFGLFVPALGVQVGLFLASPAEAGQFQETNGAVFGSHTVGTDITEIRITAEGASGGVQTGGGGNGGAGAIGIGVFTVTPGDIIRFVTGEQGQSNVGTFDAGGGGSGEPPRKSALQRG